MPETQQTMANLAKGLPPLPDLLQRLKTWFTRRPFQQATGGSPTSNKITVRFTEFSPVPSTITIARWRKNGNIYPWFSTSASFINDGDAVTIVSAHIILEELRRLRHPRVIANIPYSPQQNTRSSFPLPLARKHTKNDVWLNFLGDVPFPLSKNIPKRMRFTLHLTLLGAPDKAIRIAEFSAADIHPDAALWTLSPRWVHPALRPNFSPIVPTGTTRRIPRTRKATAD